MVTGRPAFHGKTRQTCRGHFERQPTAVSQVQPLAPPALDYLVRTCLAKDPDARFQSARDVRLQLNWIADGVGDSAAAVGVPPNRPRYAWLAAALALAALAGLTGRRAKPTPPDDRVVTRFEQPLPGVQTLARTGRRVVEVSRDGTKLVYNAIEHLYLHSNWDRPDAEPIRGTNEGPMEPLLSPDGAWLAYFARGGRTLRKVAIAGGSPVTLADLPAVSERCELAQRQDCLRDDRRTILRHIRGARRGRRTDAPGRRRSQLSNGLPAADAGRWQARALHGDAADGNPRRRRDHRCAIASTPGSGPLW